MEIKALDRETQELLKATARYPDVESILVELVGNAAGAKADYVEVLISNDQVCVRDNGEGIPYETLVKIFNKKTSGGLDGIQTIGRLQIVSRNLNSCWKSENNFVVESKGLCKSGTIITLTDLYYQVPARASPISQNRVFSIISKIEPHVLIHPQLTLKVFYENSLITTYPSAKSLRTRLQSLSGIDSFKYVSYIGKHIRVQGYTSEINSCIFNDTYQYLYVNTKAIYSTEILKRINSLYEDAGKLSNLEAKKEKKFPVFVMVFAEEFSGNFFEILEEITIMMKEQVFTGPVFSEVCEKFLIQTQGKREKPEWVSPKTYSFTGEIDDKALITVLDEGRTTEKKKSRGKKPEFAFTHFASTDVRNSIADLLPFCLEKFEVPDANSEINSGKLLFRESTLRISQLNISKIFGQVDEKFIIGVISEKNTEMLTVFDQHAAHERVQLENLIFSLFADLSYENCKVLLKITAFDHCELVKNREHLEKFQFVVKEESENLFLTRIPKLYGHVLTFADFLSALQCSSEIPPPIMKLIKSKSCRSAVKFGDTLSLPQCKEILKLLETCKFFDKCAHGRPTFYPLLTFPSVVPLPKPNYHLVK